MVKNIPIVRKYQWMKNAEGSQSFGNRMEIRPLTQKAYDKFIAPRLRSGFAESFEEYLSKQPEVTHYTVIWRENDAEWQFTGVGSLKELLETVQDSDWVIEVNDFNSPEAEAFGGSADHS